MTKLFAIAIPILAEKTEQWKNFSYQLNTRYRKEFLESRKRLGVQERTFFQSTPTGDLVIVTLEGEYPQAAFMEFGKQNDEFTKWFIAQVKDIHGIDMTQKPTSALPELVVESDQIEEKINLLTQ